MATLAQKFPHYFLQRRGCCGGCTYDSVSCSLASSSTEATTSKSEEKSEVQLGFPLQWVIVNLTFPASPGAFGRIVKLLNVGIVSQIKKMVNDPCIDVKDSEIAPTGQLEAGTGFDLPVSKVMMCSSVLASLLAFMLQ
ncbi:hypothetical protein JHK84_027707 [Glycine max]|nr:hypothetical protein JHK84_027707 [Glycine max]KAH1228704.1 hypothetical protein GmHk_10G028657 [Glycine max]